MVSKENIRQNFMKFDTIFTKMSIKEAWVSLKISLMALLLHLGKGKGKVHPITGHEDPEGEQMYKYSFFNLGATWGGGWSTPSPVCFTPGKDPVPIV